MQLRKLTPRRIVLGFRQVLFTFSQTAKLVWAANPQLLAASFLVNILSGLLIFPMIYLEKLTIDFLVKNIGNPLLGEVLKILSLLVFLRVAVSVFQSALTRFSGFLQTTIARVFSAHIDLLLAKKMAQLDAITIENPEFKDRFNKIERESGRRAWGLAIPLTQIPNFFFGLISTFSLIFFFQPAIAILTFLIVIPEFFIDAKFTRLEYEFESSIAPKYRLWGWMIWYLTKAKTLLETRLLGLGSYFLKRIKEIQDETIIASLAIRRKREMAHFFAFLPQNILIFFFSIYLGVAAMAQRITIGSAEMYLRALYSFQGNLAAFVGSVLELYENYLFITDLVWFLGLNPKVVSGKKKLPIPLGRGIEFRNVWFRYKDSQPWVLRDVNLLIPANINMAVVGENGAGKTTLVKLLFRFYDPQKGEILLDGTDIRQFDRKDLWDNLAVLFQNFEGFPFTAKESIGYGRIKEVENLDLISTSAKRAVIHRFISGLPLKYENPLSVDFEEGVEPSWGQWQRIGLARVLFRNAQIIVLDEPTSNVDPKSEEKIFNQISKFVEGKILVLISHRFSTVRRADQIVVMDKGKILDVGTHQRLMKKKGLYAQLFELQAKGYR